VCPVCKRQDEDCGHLFFQMQGREGVLEINGHGEH